MDELVVLGERGATKGEEGGSEKKRERFPVFPERFGGCPGSNADEHADGSLTAIFDVTVKPL